MEESYLKDAAIYCRISIRWQAGFAIKLCRLSAYSAFLKRRDLLFVLIVERLRKQLEWLVYVTALEGTHFAEFEPDSHSEGMTVLGADLDPAFEVHLIRDNDA